MPNPDLEVQWKARRDKEQWLGKKLREHCYERMGPEREYDVRIILYPRETRRESQ